MALTNAMLKAMGIESDQRDQIMTAHKEVVDSIKTERDELRDTAAKVPDLERQIEEYKANQPTEDWEKKYNSLNEEYEGYKAKVAQDKADEEKKSLYRSLLRESGIDAKRIDSILKITDLSDVSVKDGKIEGNEEIMEAVKKEWAEFIPQTTTAGANVETPPANNNSGTNGANPETVERLSKRHERMYGKTETKE